MLHDSHCGYLPPPMPTGRYEAVLVGDGQLPIPPVAVTLVAPTAGT
jgi:hypothetical protein